MIGRADIDLADDARAVLEPANINNRRDQQNGRQHHPVEAATHAERGQAVGDKQHDQRSGQRLRNRSVATAKRDAAQYCCRQNGHFETNADVAADRPETCGEEQRADRGQRTTRHIAQRDGATHGDTRIVGGAPRSADRSDMPTRTHPRHEDVPEDRDHDIDKRHTGNAEYRPHPEEIPRREIRQSRRDLHRIAKQQQIIGRAINDQRDQRRNKRA